MTRKAVSLLGWTNTLAGSPSIAQADVAARGEPLSSKVAAAANVSISVGGLARIKGNSMEATDLDIGHAEDFLIDPASWQVRYLTVHRARGIIRPEMGQSVNCFAPNMASPGRRGSP